MLNCNLLLRWILWCWCRGIKLWCSWLLRNGDTGWRGLRFRWWSIPITRIWFILNLLKGSIPGSQMGLVLFLVWICYLLPTRFQEFKGRFPLSFLQEQVETLAPIPIVPPEKIIAGLTQDMADWLMQAQPQAPLGKPAQLLFVPAILSEHHANKITGHPGVTKMCKNRSRSVWWPAMRRDVERLIGRCDICARNKTLKALPFGQLTPLPTPKRQWTHISMDFIVVLPKSGGRDTIWV